MKARLLAAPFLFSLFLITALAQKTTFHDAPASATQNKNPYAGQAQAAAAGKRVFLANCASCHGPNAKGTGNIPSLVRGDVQAAAPGELFWFITHGDLNSGMPAWSSLPVQQRWQVVTYLQSLGKGGSGAPSKTKASAATPKTGKPAASSANTAPAPSGPFVDFRSLAPGRTHKITAQDLPAPYATKSANNAPDVVARPANAWPQAPAGFKVELYASDLDNPRLLRTAPNGDVFLAESDPGNIKVFRGITANGKPELVGVFASGLNKPFGIAFYPRGADPQWIYIANTDAVVRFPYQNGDLKARGAAEHVADLPGEGRGHWTRNVVFSLDGKKMWVAVGSRSNVDDPDTTPSEKNRADILEFNPDGSGMRVYASGIRNAVGLEVHPKTGELWCSVNERDALGDNLVPDYITHLQEGGFYGWPWYYIGNHQDPRHAGKHPELASKVIVPDVLLQPHNASLQLTFYQGNQFPSEYQGEIFAAEHGSWNKSIRVGYEVIRVPMDASGRAKGEYQDFLTGFVTPQGDVWGRPVGVAVAKDGSLLVSDDGSNSIWRVSYAGDKAAAQKQ